jgi:hypothetical protein
LWKQNEKELQFFAFRESFHDHEGKFFFHLNCAGIFEQSMGARKVVRTELSYRPGSLSSLAGRHDNVISSWYLAPIDYSKIPALKISSRIYHLLTGIPIKREVVRNKMQSLAFHCM